MNTEQALLYCEGLAKMASHTHAYLKRRLEQNRIALDTQVAIVDGLLNYAKNTEYVVNYSGKPVTVLHPLQQKQDKPSVHELVRKMYTMLGQIEERVFQVSMDKTKEALESTLTEGT